jgi:hypothetical protein
MIAGEEEKTNGNGKTKRCNENGYFIEVLKIFHSLFFTLHKREWVFLKGFFVLNKFLVVACVTSPFLGQLVNMQLQI